MSYNKYLRKADGVRDDWEREPDEEKGVGNIVAEVNNLAKYFKERSQEAKGDSKKSDDYHAGVSEAFMQAAYKVMALHDKMEGKS